MTLGLLTELAAALAGEAASVLSGRAIVFAPSRAPSGSRNAVSASFCDLVVENGLRAVLAVLVFEFHARLIESLDVPGSTSSSFST